jgi:hypothetical protein
MPKTPGHFTRLRRHAVSGRHFRRWSAMATGRQRQYTPGFSREASRFS